MSTLKIDGFLSIKSATIDIKPLTILIGPQAQGKSIVAKLAYYFETSIRRLLQEVVSGEITITALRKNLIERFIELFPRQAWSPEPFSITYSIQDWIFTVTRDGSRKNSSITLTFSAELVNEITALIKEFKPLLKDSIAKKQTYYIGQIKRQELRAFFKSRVNLHSKLNEQVFVPASRSFFANVEKNIFSLISSNFDIDPLMAEFGSTLEQARIVSRFEQNDRQQSSKRNKVEVLFEGWKHIIQGGYLYDGKDEFIVSNDRRVKLSNSSSGQQEVIPLLIALSFDPMYLHGHSYGGTNYFIEEPEAHLFPYAQKSIAEILVRKLNEKKGKSIDGITLPTNKVMVTTHSPYILTAINNLVFAGHVYKNNNINRSRIEKIIPHALAIEPAEISAYKINNGVATSIINKKNTTN